MLSPNGNTAVTAELWLVLHRVLRCETTHRTGACADTQNRRPAYIETFVNVSVCPLLVSTRCCVWVAVPGLLTAHFVMCRS